MPFITQFNGKKPDSGGNGRRVEKGAVDNARKSLVSVLEERFERIPADAMAALTEIEDPQALTLLLRSAVKAKSLKEFLSVLKGE